MCRVAPGATGYAQEPAICRRINPPSGLSLLEVDVHGGESCQTSTLYLHCMRAGHSGLWIKTAPTGWSGMAYCTLPVQSLSPDLQPHDLFASRICVSAVSCSTNQELSVLYMQIFPRNRVLATVPQLQRITSNSAFRGACSQLNPRRSSTDDHQKSSRTSTSLRMAAQVLAPTTRRCIGSRRIVCPGICNALHSFSQLKLCVSIT